MLDLRSEYDQWLRSVVLFSFGSYYFFFGFSVPFGHIYRVIRLSTTELTAGEKSETAIPMKCVYGKICCKRKLPMKRNCSAMPAHILRYNLKKLFWMDENGS